jgi:hypothetical protein
MRAAKHVTGKHQKLLEKCIEVVYLKGILGMCQLGMTGHPLTWLMRWVSVTLEWKNRERTIKRKASFSMLVLYCYMCLSLLLWCQCPCEPPLLYMEWLHFWHSPESSGFQAVFTKHSQLFPRHFLIFCFAFLLICLNYNKAGEIGNPSIPYSEWSILFLMVLNAGHICLLTSLFVIYFFWLRKLVGFK